VTLRDVNAEVVDYAVSSESPLVGRTIQDLRLPDGAIVALVSREGTPIAPRGSTRLQAADHLFVIARTSDRIEVDRLLGHDRA
jgi:cell volume regulation protein A